MSTGPSRNYWDSNVWAAYLLKGGDPHYGACRPLFDDMRDGTRRVYMSSLVAGEVVQVVRRETARAAARGKGGSRPSPQAAMASADEIVDGFLGDLAHLHNSGRVLIQPPPPNAKRYAALALKTLIRHKGHVEPHGKMGLIYRGLGMLDMMHALTARGYGADNFCTRDRQFAALAGDPEFRAIDFVVF